MIDRRRALLLAPFGVAVAAGTGFYTILGRMRTGTFDPHEVPSQLINQPAPAFAVSGQDPGQGFASTDLKSIGLRGPILLNFFASWCVPCIVEHPELMALSREGLAVWGVAYKDQPAAAAAFIARHGNPYTRIGRDPSGTVAIDFGLYGVPESYLIDRSGIVRWRNPGPLTPAIIDERLRPALRALA